MFREYIALPAHSLIRLPESSHSFTEWAAILGTGSAIGNAFNGNRGLMRGYTVLVLGTALFFSE